MTNSEAKADDPMLGSPDRLGRSEVSKPVRRGLERLDEGEDDKRQEDRAEGIAKGGGKKVLYSTQSYTSKEIEESDCEQWECRTCTLLNSLTSYICSACYSAFRSLQLHLQRLERPSTEYSPYLRRRPQSDEFRRSVVRPTCKTCYRQTPYDIDKCTDCQLEEIKAGVSEGGSRLQSSYKFWNCKSCSKRNSGLTSTCYYCNKPDSQPPHTSLTRPRKFLEACKKCRAFNVHDSSKCEKCRSSMVIVKEEPKPRKFIEICKSCEHRNKRDASTCESCYRSMRPPSSQMRRTYQS
jgi:hypothetical protein